MPAPMASRPQTATTRAATGPRRARPSATPEKTPASDPEGQVDRREDDDKEDGPQAVPALQPLVRIVTNRHGEPCLGDQRISPRIRPATARPVLLRVRSVATTTVLAALSCHPCRRPSPGQREIAEEHDQPGDYLNGDCGEFSDPGLLEGDPIAAASVPASPGMAHRRSDVRQPGTPPSARRPPWRPLRACRRFGPASRSA